MTEVNDFILQWADGVPYKLKKPYDFSFLNKYGKVFKVYDNQDSGNICFGVDDGKTKRFVKFAGAPTVRSNITSDEAIERMKTTEAIYRDLAHTNLTKLINTEVIAGGFMCVFEWVNSECMGRMYPESREKFMQMPIETRLQVYDEILAFHAHVARQGYVAIDFYDGCIMYDFDTGKTTICDIEFYSKMPYKNPMGRMWGSSRFMSPEEFQLGADIDEITNVYNMGATAFALFGDERDRCMEKWMLSSQAFDVATRAVSDDQSQRQQSIEQLIEEWKEAQNYTRPDEQWRVYTTDLGELKEYRYTVIFARSGANWIYPRHKDRDTYETAGGRIEADETPLECAKRELQEETGAIKFFIHPAFDYAVHTDKSYANGQVFYADVETLGELPINSEMKEVREFRSIPEKMTYPHILPVLYDRLDKWLGKEKAETEYWDILDKNRNPTGRLHRRIDKMQPGDYHLVVRAWIMNSKGEFLITRRAFNKIGYPGLWEIPSGSATAGEESLGATIREAGEECGLVLLPETAELFSTYQQFDNAFHDNWLFRHDFDLSDVVLQEGETIDARAASWSEISAMMERGEFVKREVFPEFNLLEVM